MKRQIMKITFYGTILLFFSGMYSCSVTKHASKPKANNKQVNFEKNEPSKFESAFDLSARTKLFIKAVEDEMNSFETTIEFYIPSNELVQEYGLKKQNDEYVIRGFIKSTSSFEKSKFETKGINLGKKTGEMMTISFPLRFLQEFLNSKHITYFEISEQVTNK
jgi:hypothetical protein